MRLDQYLVEAGYVPSRERAKRMILSGSVLVDGIVANKPAIDVVGSPVISVTEERFVGRGGEKLEGALKLFGLDPTGLSALDIGASTGGFTDCLLQNGAVSVIALDAGSGQLHPRLLADKRVRNIEKYNARELAFADVGTVDFVVMDVSFISQTYILPRIPSVLRLGGSLVSLIKPQFEAGRGALNKQGIVKKEKDRIFAISKVFESAKKVGLFPVGLAPSPIKGGDGNVEYLAYFKLDSNSATHVGITPEDIEKTVKNGEVILCKRLP